MANTEGRDVVERLRGMASGEKAGELGEQEAAALLAVVEAAKEAQQWVGVSEDKRGGWCPPSISLNLDAALARLYDGSSGDA